MANKWGIGVLIITILLSGALYVALLEQGLKIRVDPYKSSFYVFNEDTHRWNIAGREYNKLLEGTKLMYRDKSNIKVEYINGTDDFTIIRTTPYIRKSVIKDIYYFEGNTIDKELFPIYHTIEIFNATGYYYKYVVKDLTYDGGTFKLDGNQTTMSFGKNMKVSWWDKYRLGWVYKSGSMYVKSEKIDSDYIKFNVRLFDPEPIKLNKTIIKAPKPNPIEENPNFTVVENKGKFDYGISTQGTVIFSRPFINQTIAILPLYQEWRTPTPSNTNSLDIVEVIAPVKERKDTILVTGKQNITIEPINNMLSYTLRYKDKYVIPNYLDFSADNDTLIYSFLLSYSNLKLLVNGSVWDGSEQLMSGNLYFTDGISDFGISIKEPYIKDDNGTYPIPYRVRSNDTAVFMDLEIPYSLLSNLSGEIIIDPSAVAGCDDTNATVFICRDGSFTGHFIDTAKAILIENATIDATNSDGANGMLNLTSNNYLHIFSSTIDATGDNSVNTPGTGKFIATINGSIFINDSTLTSNGGSNSGANSFDNAGSPAFFYMNASTTIDINLSTINSNGGNGIGTSSGQPTPHGGGTTTFINSSTSISSYGSTFNFNGGNGGSRSTNNNAGGGGSTTFKLNTTSFSLEDSTLTINGGAGGTGSAADTVRGSGGASTSTLGIINLTFINSTYTATAGSRGGGSGTGGSDGSAICTFNIKDLVNFSDATTLDCKSGSAASGSSTFKIQGGNKIISSGTNIITIYASGTATVLMNATNEVTFFENFTISNNTLHSSTIHINGATPKLGLFNTAWDRNHTDVLCGGSLVVGNDSAVSNIFNFSSDCDIISYRTLLEYTNGIPTFGNVARIGTLQIDTFVNLSVNVTNDRGLIGINLDYVWIEHNITGQRDQ